MSTDNLNDLRRMRAAKNQSLFQEVNERVEDIAKTFNLDDRQLDFLCECAHTDCTERLGLSVTEYEALRRVPTHSAIALGHEIPDVEHVVERTSRYVVVAKIGAGGALAQRLDPRQAEHA